MAARGSVRCIGVITLILVMLFGSLLSVGFWFPHWRVHTDVLGNTNGFGVMTTGEWGTQWDNGQKLCRNIKNANGDVSQACWTSVGGECWCIDDDSLYKLMFFLSFQSCNTGLQLADTIMNAVWMGRGGLLAAGGIMFLSLYVSCCVIGCANTGSALVMVVFAVLSLIAFLVGFVPANRVFISNSFECNGVMGLKTMFQDYDISYAYYCTIAAGVILVVIIVLNIIAAKLASNKSDEDTVVLAVPIAQQQYGAVNYQHGYSTGGYNPNYTVYQSPQTPAYQPPAYAPTYKSPA